MSGFAALYETSGAPAGEALISAMLGRLRYRGPDRSGHHVAGPVALAQCMLETTLEDAFERQPQRSSSGDLWIVADARIDNRAELLALGGPRREGGAHGAETPDSTLILEAYQRWGEACPAKLVGDFAFVIWDGARRALFCARDHLGVRPLYYHHDAAAFRCASAMHALFADRRVPRRPDRRSVALYLVVMYAEDGPTLYEGVSALPAGCSLTVTPGGVQVRAYWQPDARRSTRYASDDAYAAHFRELFSEAVRCRMRADRPLAAEVSGGLDSSSVACEAERLRRAGLTAGPPIALLHVAFPGLVCDEGPYAQAVADHLGLPLFNGYPLDDPDLCRIAPLPPPDHTFDPSVQFLPPLLAESARRGIRVTLNGIGGDQLMRATGHEGIHHLLRGRARDAAIEAGLGEAPRSARAWRNLFTDGILALGPPALARALLRARSRRREWRYLTPAMCEMANESVELAALRARALHPDPLERTLRDDLMHGPSTPFSLALGDRAAAHVGQERRYPFLDVRLIEYLLSIPNEQRFYRGLPKPVLRRAMVGTLPALVRERTDKADFLSFFQRGFWESQAGAVRALLQRSRLEEIGIADGDKIRRALAASEPNVFGLADLVTMELWLHQVMSPAPKAAGLPTEASEEQHGCAG